MRVFLKTLRDCPLFRGIDEEKIPLALKCLGAKQVEYKKGEAILREGEDAGRFGIVLSGEAQIVRVDFYGNRSILASVRPPQIFGESFACAGISAIPVSVIATQPTCVLLIDSGCIFGGHGQSCAFHERIIFNLLNITARKNLEFNQKLEILSKRSTREKLMTYLLMEAKKSGSDSFAIPFDRQELADYLGVDRSGLSSEISKLKRENVLKSEKNHFTLLLNI